MLGVLGIRTFEVTNPMRRLGKLESETVHVTEWISMSGVQAEAKILTGTSDKKVGIGHSKSMDSIKHLCLANLG